MPIKPKKCRVCKETYYIAYGGGVCGKNGCNNNPELTNEEKKLLLIKGQLDRIEKKLNKLLGE